MSVSNEILNFHFHCKCCTFESLIQRMIPLQLKRNGKRSSELKRRRRFFSLLQTSLLEFPQAKWRTQRPNVHRTFILRLLVFGPAWNDILQQRYRRYLLSCSLPIVNSFFWAQAFSVQFCLPFPSPSSSLNRNFVGGNEYRRSQSLLACCQTMFHGNGNDAH